MSLSSLPTIIFYCFLSLIFLLEGLGWRGGRDAALALVIIMPVFLFILDGILSRKISFPQWPTIFYGGFLLFSLLSTFFSVDVMRSFIYLLFYTSLFLNFVYVWSHKDEIQKYLIPFLFTFSFVVCVYSLLVPFLIKSNPGFFLPVDGGQYVYPLYGLHNSRGDLLILPVLISIYFILMKHKKLLYIFSFIFFLPFFILSYSRSAYFALGIGLFLMLVYLVNKKRIMMKSWGSMLVLVCILGLGVLFFATTKEFGERPFFQPVNKLLIQDFNFADKSFVSRRDLIYGDALTTIINKPLFGIGPHNYIYISGKYSYSDGITTDTAHSLFLDIFSENGVVAGVFFLLFIGYWIIRSRKDLILFFVSLVMLLDFQTFYLYRFYSFCLLFFILLGMNCRGKERG
jgi:hypothetical protein